MNTAVANPNPSDANDLCRIVVIYDGDETRTRALAACDSLVRQFWEEVELDFHWWRTDFLRDATLADAAARDAIRADFLLICSDSEYQLSPLLTQWFSGWLEQRGDRLGALVDLGAVRGRQFFRSSPHREAHLREICRRGSFDYLAGFGAAEINWERGENPSATLPGQDAGDTRPPSHYGLNE